MASTKAQQPKLVRGSQDRDLACIKCGRYKFPDLASARYHQFTCDGRAKNIKGPWMCKGCGKADFTKSQAFGSHRTRCPAAGTFLNDTEDGNELCRSRYVTINAISIGDMKPPSLGSSRIQLSDYNYLVTEWVDFVQATETDTLKSLLRGRPMQAGDIGIRCLACSRANQYLVGSLMFPGKLEHLSHSLYNLVVRHMIHSCLHIPSKVKEQLRSLKKTTTSQSMSKDRLGLPSYLQMLFRHFGLQNKVEGLGIRRRTKEIECLWQYDGSDLKGRCVFEEDASSDEGTKQNGSKKELSTKRKRKRETADSEGKKRHQLKHDNSIWDPRCAEEGKYATKDTLDDHQGTGLENLQDLIARDDAGTDEDDGIHFEAV